MHIEDVGPDAGDPAIGGEPTNEGEQPSRAKHRGRELVGLAAALVAGIVYLLGALTHSLWDEDRPGPGLIPFVVAVTIVVSATLAAIALHTGDDHDAVSPLVLDDDEGGEREFGPAFWRVPALVACLVAYVLVVDRLGHLITSGLLVWAALLIIGGRSWWQQLGFAVLLAFGSFAIFDLVLGVPLPEGRF